MTKAYSSFLSRKTVYHGAASVCMQGKGDTEKRMVKQIWTTFLQEELAQPISAMFEIFINIAGPH